MENVMRMKTCLRCGGNVFPARDDDGAYVFCLQCGAIVYQSRPKSIRVPLQSRKTYQESTPRMRTGLR
jgi:ribosomal protein S27AE